MNSGMTRPAGLLETLESQLALIGDPCEVLSIFAGAVYWETIDDFKRNDDPDHDMSRLLEVRAYTEIGEFHAQRSNIADDCDFHWRTVVDDGEGDGATFFDDVQRIDRDEARSAHGPEGRLYTTSGGAFDLPDRRATKVRLRNYIEYDDDGMAQVVDFRIVRLEGFVGEGGVR